MARTIRARFSHGVIEPLEKIEFLEGEEFTVIVSEVPEIPRKKELKTPIHLVKADVFVKHAGLISIGGNAVEDSDRYDE